jgi:hypothetical protein
MIPAANLFQDSRIKMARATVARCLFPCLAFVNQEEGWLAGAVEVVKHDATSPYVTVTSQSRQTFKTIASCPAPCFFLSHIQLHS